LNTTPQPELIPKGPGDVLRQARVKRRWTVEFVAQAIKVRPEVLIAIERGDTSHIPPVYLKGYMRSYAREVGVPQDIISPLLSKSQAVDPEVQSIFKEGLPRSHGDRWFKAGSYALASAVVIALVWQFTNEAVRFSQGDPLLRSSQTENSAPLTAVESGSEDGVNANYITETLPAKRHLRASIASMSGSQEQVSSTRPQVAEGAWAAIGSHHAESGAADAMAAGMETLEVSTSADSWVEIIDGADETIEMDLLRAGSKRTYRGVAPFRLLLGRASSVEVIHNGEKVNLAPYMRGNVARLTLGGNESGTSQSDTSDAKFPVIDAEPPDQG
jgi:cytoskeleton protein RodZ